MVIWTDCIFLSSVAWPVTVTVPMTSEGGLLSAGCVSVTVGAVVSGAAKVVNCNGLPLASVATVVE